MAELTEQQEQELIAAAKTGDPKANYDLSMWALERAKEEPEEQRWNRLAAKCLVRSAEAGYQPAKEAMDRMLKDAEDAQPAQPAQNAQPAPQPAQQPQTPWTAPRQQAPQGDGAAMGLGAIFGKKQAQPRQPRQKAPGGFSFKDIASWDEAKWKKVQNIAIAACAVLALLIIVIIVASTGKGNKAAKQEAEEEVITEPVATVEPTATPEPETYPDDETKEEIAALSLDYYPADDDYVTEATTGTVNTTGSNVRLRKGPGTDYDIVKEISNGTEVNIYAENNDWYLIECSGTWGWASGDYIKK